MLVFFLTVLVTHDYSYIIYIIYGFNR
jgi:hypothetical protein